MKQHAVKELPTMVEIFSYTFFCGGASIGVFFEFSDYIKFIKQEGHFARIPNPIGESAKYLLAAFFFAGVNQALQIKYHDDHFNSDEFRSQSMLCKYFDIWMYNYQFRTFYYIGFMLQTSSVIASGLGFSGVKDGKFQWETIVSVYLWNLETCYSVASTMQNWNHQVHVWLKYYVQHRLVKVGEYPTLFATCATFFVSALWHGIYPVYFLCFFYMFILIELSKDFWKAGDKFAKVLPSRSVRIGIAYVGTMYNAAYFAIMWRLRSPEKVWQFWHTTMCVPFASTMVMCLVSRATGFAKVPRPKVKDQ